MLINRFYYSSKDKIKNPQSHQAYTKYKKLTPNTNIQPRNNNQIDKQQFSTYGYNQRQQQQQHHPHQFKMQPDIYLHCSVPKIQPSSQSPYPPNRIPHFHQGISGLKAITGNTLWDNTQNNINFYFPDLYNNFDHSSQFIYYNKKPQTACGMKRPEERLRKGQNQLILERLQEKFASKLMSGKMRKTQTGSWFYKKKKSMSLRQLEKPGKLKATNTSHISNHSKKISEKDFIDVIDKKFDESKPENKHSELNGGKKEIIIDSPFDDGNDVKISFIKTITKDFGFKRKTVTTHKRDKDNGNKSLDEINTNNDNNNHNKEEKQMKLTNNNIDSNVNTNFSPQETIKISQVKHKEKQPNTKINNNINDNNNKETTIKLTKSSINLRSRYELSLNKDFSFSNLISNNKPSNNNDNSNNNTSKTNKEFASKTSSNFFKPSSNSNASNNIDNIINRVLENNQKAAAMRSNNFFNEMNRGFMNNQMRRTNNSFYKPYPSTHRFNMNSEKDYFINQNQPKTLNSLQLTLLTPLEWRKHEEIWTNISQLSFVSPELEKHLLPPNDSDILISSYLKLHPSLLNFCSYSNIMSSSQKQVNYLSFNVDDNIKNPKNEMKKWKDAYKLAVHRWHPDKLFPLLEELKLKDENKKQLLKKKSTIIINNMNNLYKQIIEILRKVYQAKNANGNNINI